jgi:hypothetical protein
MMTEEELIRDAVSKMTLPKEVKSIDFSFSEDSTGMPAVWINLHVAEDFKPSAAKVNKLSAVKKDISKRIFETNAVAWPYIRLVTE